MFVFAHSIVPNHHFHSHQLKTQVSSTACQEEHDGMLIHVFQKYTHAGKDVDFHINYSSKAFFFNASFIDIFYDFSEVLNYFYSKIKLPSITNLQFNLLKGYNSEYSLRGPPSMCY
ncbi:MAG: hypothetical protein JSU07_11030 [Bacteroidetes bacterium]|nr:hypothetical protein [Bacteroidota bacterium]